MKRLLGRRCKTGHPLDGANGSWQLSGNGWPVLTCRACNAARAKAWRAANADRLVYVHPRHTGKQLPRRTPA